MSSSTTVPVSATSRNTILRIPIPVLEELDQFKKGTQIINHHAREFVREIDKLSTGKLFNGNMTLGEGKGVLAIRLDKEMHSDLLLVFPNAEQIFAVDALLNRRIKLVTITGKAGTGKTLIALAAALESRAEYRQILLTRPIVPLSNKDLGFLPGDIAAKIKPSMQPLYDNLAVISGQFPEKSEMFQRLRVMLEGDKLAIEPLAYIRGRSLVKMFMIVDEAQNLTPHEVKTIITRAGEGTKIVLTGDINQIDHFYLGIHSNGLRTLIDKMQRQKIYSHIDLRKGERSELAELASNIL